MAKERWQTLKVGQSVRIKGNCSIVDDNRLIVNTSYPVENK